MQIVCGHPNGFKLHLDDFRDGNEVELHHGVNEVDDIFGKAWMALHRDDHNNVLPMVADGSIYELPSEPKAAKKPEAVKVEPGEEDGA